MKIVIALDSFKGSCSAQAACAAVAKGLRRVSDRLQLTEIPVSDGGEGLLTTLANSPLLSGVHWREQICCGPYGQPVVANYLQLDDDRAILEMAQCCGLELTPKDERDVRRATSYGLGELVKSVLDNGIRHITLGLGGSATNDAGMGFAQALGVRFYDQHDQLIASPACALDMVSVRRIDLSGLDTRWRESDIQVCCDVSNPLLGEYGATWVYGRQKGADVTALTELENGMSHFSQLMTTVTKRDINNTAGSGAAGGMGAALLWYGNARLSPGIELVLELLNAQRYLSQAELVIIGEGWLDRQSVFGKAPVGVATMAARYQVPVIALCGGRDDESRELYQHHVAAIWSICPRPMSLETAISKGETLLADAAENLLRTFLAGRHAFVSTENNNLTENSLTGHHNNGAGSPDHCEHEQIQG